MATLNWQTLDEAHKGGSDLIKVGLTAAQMAELTGDVDADASWILFSYLAETGGTVGRDRDVAVEYTEGSTRDESITRDEGVVKGAVRQTSKRVMDLLDFLEDNYVAAVRFLPLKVPGANGETHQVWASEKAKVDRENWTVATGRTDQRTRSFTLRLYKTDPNDATVKPYLLEEVDATDEADWPATLDPFKEAAFAAAP